MELPKRKSPRIPRYDYSSPNYYFITICTRNKQCIFGSIKEKSKFGEIVEACILELKEHYSYIHVDKYVVMPNHVHMILILDSKNEKVSLNTVMGQYKSGVSRRIHRIDPDLMVWQRSFHDHVIRNQSDYERIWSYIDTNPMRWDKDCFYVE